MKKYTLLLLLGIIIGIFLAGFTSTSFAKDGCGPSTPSSNGDGKKAGGDIVDRPDDTVDVSTYDGIMLHPSGYASISILQNGYYGFTAALLEKLKEPYAVHDLSLPSDTLKDHPILIIPSGGLFGLEGSLLVKQRLAEYVYNGGTIICFTQQHGYEFSALPGGKLDGFGWREDQSCWRGGAYISKQHPMFAGQDTIYVDANIDGYFSQWTDDSSILLRRTKNSMPTILAYPWGKGRVIATTLYCDQGFVMNHIAIVEYALKIQNQTSITYNSTINLTVTSIGDGQIYKNTLGLNIPAQGSITQTATFTLPYAMAGGVCIFDAQAYSKGEKIGQAITTFNTPQAIIIIDPILPPAFGYTSTAAFKVTNVGALALPPGTLAVIFKDSLNNVLWAGTNTYGTITLYGSSTLNFNISIPQIKFEEVYKLAYNLIGEFTTLADEIEIPCSNVIKLGFDKPSYRIRENLGMNLKITNTGKFKEDLLRIVSIPDCNFAGTDSVTLLPNETGSITYNFTIPETTLSGLHSAEATLMLGTSTITKSFSFFIPPAQIVFDKINRLTLAAPETGSFTLKNIGGVDETYDYIVRIIDERNVTIFEKTNTIEIRAGEVSIPIEFNIPNQALDSGYTLAILTTDSKSQHKNFYKPLHIQGINAQININPDKKVYLADDEVNLITQITNLNGTINDATLTVKAFSSVEEWLCYAEVNDICDMAVDGNFIWFATPGGAKRYDKITDKFTTYTAIDGLAGNDVTTIAVDNQFVWLGIRYNGLSRYDKIHNTWQTFTKADGLVNNEVTSIVVGTDTVWVGSWDGAARYDKTQGSWKTYRIADTQPGNFINDIAIDGNLVWFATYDGIRRYDARDDSWTGYTTQNGLAHNQVHSIGIDGNYIWFGSPDGLTTRYDKSNDLFNIFVTSVNQPENKVNAITTGTNSVWFATNKGITQYDKINHLWKTFTTQDGLAGNQTKAIGIDDDMVWAGGNDGISKYKPAAPWQTYTIVNGLADNEVTAINIDSGIIWFATVRGGLSQYNKMNDSFKNLTTADGLSSNHVKAIAADSDYVWLVTHDGISRCERIGNGFQNLRYDMELLPYGGRGLELHSAMIDSGYIWFAGYGGVIRLDKTNSTFRRFTTNDGLIDTHINAVAKDSEYIYFGTQKGVSRYNRINQTWDNIHHLDNMVIYSIDTEDDAVWFGTEQGLYRYDKSKDTIRRFTAINSGLLKSDVRVVKASGGFVWCATHDGVCRYDKANDTWQVYTTKDGLPSNFIRAMAIDSDYVYLATDHGVGRLQTKGRLLYQESKNINITSPDATFTTNIGKVVIPGKSYIEANLVSKLTQVIDISSNSFHVISKDVYLVISTDKPVYKPQEPIIITATAYNCLSTSTSELSLVLRKDEAIILSEAFILPPNGSNTFTKTIKSDGSFVLAGFLNSEKTTEYIRVMPPEVSVIITVPEIVARDEFDASVQLKNTSELKVNIRPRIIWADIAEDLGTITLSPNQATFVQQKCKFTKSGTITVILSGDIERVEDKRVIFGEQVTVEVTPKQLYPQGVVVVPFSLTNTGRCDSEVEVTFTLQQPQALHNLNAPPLTQLNSLPQWCKNMPRIRIKEKEIGRRAARKAPDIANIDCSNNSITIKQGFCVPMGTTAIGELIYDLEEGSYVIDHSSFFGSGAASFKAAKNDVVGIEIEIPEKIMGYTEQQLPINVTVSNLGANEFKGGLRIDTGFYQDSVPLGLGIGETKTFTFIGTTSGSAGTYTILAEALHNDKVILSESKTFELIPQFAFEEIPADLSFTIGKRGTITLRVRNNGNGEGNIWVQLKIADIINETKPIWIKPKDFGSVSFNISIPDDIEDRDYSAYIILKTEKGEEIHERIYSTPSTDTQVLAAPGLKRLFLASGAEAFDVVLSPRITLISPTIGRVGSLVTVKGSGFGSNENIRIDFGTTITSTMATTDIIGNFTAVFTTTQQSADGTVTITATGLSSGTSATRSLFILDSTPPGIPAWGTITIKSDREVSLEWKADIEHDLAGYRIYYGTSTGNYSTIIDIKPPASTHTLTNLATDTTCYVVLTAYDYVGNESSYSQEKGIGTTQSMEVSAASIVGGNRIATVTITGVSHDVVQVVFEVSSSNGTYVIGTDTTSPYEIYWNPAGINDGTVTVAATAIDLAGLKTSVSTTTKVDNTGRQYLV
ncbi:MAG: hypothetical protein ABIJ30_02240 [bacterium]